MSYDSTTISRVIYNRHMKLPTKKKLKWLRLGQAIENALRYFKITTPLFYIENEELEQLLKEYLKTNKR